MLFIMAPSKSKKNFEESPMGFQFSVTPTISGTSPIPGVAEERFGRLSGEPFKVSDEVSLIEISGIEGCFGKGRVRGIPIDERSQANDVGVMFWR